LSIAVGIMARKKTSESDRRPPDGVVLGRNLCRLGYCETVVKTTEVSKLISERTGRHISRQRIAQLLNAVSITPGMLSVLAKGLGVSEDELSQWEGE
jgi:hypothetical protein